MQLLSTGSSRSRRGRYDCIKRGDAPNSNFRCKNCEKFFVPMSSFVFSFVLLCLVSLPFVYGLIRCNNDPDQLPPLINGSRSDLSLNVQDNGIILQCSASYAVSWMKLQPQANKLPTSYQFTILTNGADITVTNQNSGSRNFTSALHLRNALDQFSIYGCVSSQDLDLLKSSNIISSTAINQIRLTKIFLQIWATAQFSDTTLNSCAHLTRKNLKAEALLQMLNGNLLASRSATLTLEQWCGDHKLAPIPKVVAKTANVSGNPPPLPSQAQSLMRLSASDTVRHRRVELSCGDRVLSVADNWYVSNRLTPGMNDDLDNTDTPYGKVVAPLQPFRQTSEVKFLWQPLPPGWEMNCPSAVPPTTIPATVLEIQAAVITKAGLPIAFVDEQYTKAMFDFM